MDPSTVVRPFARVLLIGSSTVLLAACMAAGAPAPPGPPLEADQVAFTAERLTRPDRPVRMLFDWSLNEPGLRTRGRGLARMEPPYRVRLDLFTPGGEAVAVAAVDGEEMRLPPGSPAILPPPALLWAALGIFRPGDGVILEGGEGDPTEEVTLRYRLPDGNGLRYRLRRRVILEVELTRGGRVVERLSRESGDENGWGEAVYRDLVAVRELRVNVENSEDVESFPPDIWNPIR